MVFNWPPKKRSFKLNVVIPSSNLQVYPTLREKTEFVGRIARALATYRVNNVVIVNDEGPSRRDSSSFMGVVLSYLMVPPYLRKKLVPLTKELRFAGLLPPTNVFVHNPENRLPVINELREGMVTKSWGTRARVFIGHREGCMTDSSRIMRPGERVLVRIISTNPLRCREEDPEKVPEYVGYRVYEITEVHGLPSFLARIGAGTTVLTTKNGEIISGKVAKALLKDACKTGALTLLFGNPSEDFDRLVPEQVRHSLQIRYRINFIPEQGVLSVRTDEALNAVLAVINVFAASIEKKKPNKG